jgi:hypothetical protein
LLSGVTSQSLVCTSLLLNAGSWAEPEIEEILVREAVVNSLKDLLALDYRSLL